MTSGRGNVPGVGVQCRYSRDIDIAGRVPRIASALHPDPEERRVSEQLGKANGNLGAEGFPLAQDGQVSPDFWSNAVGFCMLARNPGHPRDFGIRFPGSGDHVLAEQFAWMRRAAVRIAVHSPLLVILREVQGTGVAVAELERDAPRPIQMDREAGWRVTSQRMEVDSRQIHVLWRRRGIKGGQPPQDAITPRESIFDLSVSQRELRGYEQASCDAEAQRLAHVLEYVRWRGDPLAAGTGDVGPLRGGVEIPGAVLAKSRRLNCLENVPI